MYKNNPRKNDNDSNHQKVVRKGRNISLFGEINEDTVLEVIQHLIQIELESNKRPITFLLNSAGGNCYDGFALYDWMRSCKAPIITIGLGLVASMAFIIYLAGDRRISAISTRYMNHQVSADVGGKITDIKIQQHEMDAIEEVCIRIIAGRTGLSPKLIQKEIKIGDKYYSAKEAMEKGIVHEIVEYVDKSKFKISDTLLNNE